MPTMMRRLNGNRPARYSNLLLEHDNLLNEDSEFLAPLARAVSPPLSSLRTQSQVLVAKARSQGPFSDVHRTPSFSIGSGAKQIVSTDSIITDTITSTATTKRTSLNVIRSLTKRSKKGEGSKPLPAAPAFGNNVNQSSKQQGGGGSSSSSSSSRARQQAAWICLLLSGQSVKDHMETMSSSRTTQSETMRKAKSNSMQANSVEPLTPKQLKKLKGKLNPCRVPVSQSS